MYFRLILSPLLFSLFIYLFFRPEETLITNLFISIISLEKYTLLKKSITELIPLSPLIIYSIPGGLWVFGLTVTAKNLYIPFGRKAIHCIYIPLLFAIALEFFQFMHISRGTFDAMDIVVSILFWLAAILFVKHSPARKSIFKPFDRRSFLFVSTYTIVHLARVLN